MKRSFLFIAATLVAVIAICSCNKEDEQEPAKFEYKAPYTRWSCSIDEVRSYMRSVGEFTEVEPVPLSDGSTSYTFVNKSYVSYTYTTDKNGELVHSAVGYLDMDKHFDEFFSTIKTTCGITEWKEIVYGNAPDVWAVEGVKSDGTKIRIIRDTKNSHMSAAFFSTSY